MSKKHKKTKKEDILRERLKEAICHYKKTCVFSGVCACILIDNENVLGKNEPCRIMRWGTIYLNPRCNLSIKEWSFLIAHGVLHSAFGHFDAEKMPGYEVEDGNGKKKIVECDDYLWNLACDIYITRFLEGMKYGESTFQFPVMNHISKHYDENQIYEYLKEHPSEIPEYSMDMEGLKEPVYYKEGQVNRRAEDFAFEMAYEASNSIRKVSGQEEQSRWAYRMEDSDAAKWFIDHYPLLGSLAATFKLIKDHRVCQQHDIQIAAVDIDKKEIYLNPVAGLSNEEMKFVLAHEFLHAGLQHHSRCLGRDHFLWNIATDYVINGWLVEMGIGEMPEGILYEDSFNGMSAESVYDLLLADVRYYMKQNTLRGYGKGDVIGNGKGSLNGIPLDDIYRESLAQGLEYHQNQGRGFVPQGLIEEIRALAMPAIRWDVELARWFDENFPLQNKSRSYVRASRRQGSTPDIPRPGYIHNPQLDEVRTFGVVIDTSGSMTAEMIGKALGSIASYAAAKEVPLVRVIFCDASAYDAGYLTPEEIAGRIKVKGRGGTYLTPAVELLEQAKDFPDTGPILIITDGEIEERLSIHRKHAFLIPQGRKLPFKAKGEVFYFH